MRFEIEFYEKENGEKPVEIFLDSVSEKVRAKIIDNIVFLRDNGSTVREPKSKHIDDGIFELRTQLGSTASRILYFFFVGRRIILTNGFIKKTQKTPIDEIEKAKEYRKRYIERKNRK